jgi:cytochrome c-type biogenesis protein CcsB
MSAAGTILYSFTLSLYLVSSILFFLDLKEREKGLFSYAGLGLKAGLLSLSVLILVRFIATRSLPGFTFHGTLLLMTFAGSLSLVLLELLKPGFKRALYFALPLVTLFLLLAGFFPGDRAALVPQLAGFWLFLHILAMMSAYGALAVAFILSLLYLLVDYCLKKKKVGGLLLRLPSLDVLDNLNYLLVAFGFIMLTLSIVLGAVCGERVWGSFWRWSPKETWVLITWLVYAAYIYTRLLSGWRGKNIVMLNLLGFGAIIFNYFIVRFVIGGGLHTFF